MSDDDAMKGEDVKSDTGVSRPTLGGVWSQRLSTGMDVTQ